MTEQDIIDMISKIFQNCPEPSQYWFPLPEDYKDYLAIVHQERMERSALSYGNVLHLAQPCSAQWKSYLHGWGNPCNL